jgi:hypothetical protein
MCIAITLYYVPYLSLPKDSYASTYHVTVGYVLRRYSLVIDPLLRFKPILLKVENKFKMLKRSLLPLLLSSYSLV